ncbi:MAG TPA: NAD(P)/FAD-dependent oxidoreductase [Kofleriaceae bacterium]
MTLIRNAVVIGAGLSGLVCARRLVAAGLEPLVLEARQRVGGRLWTGRVAGAVVDLGGQWLSVDQPRLLALAGELGVASVPQPRAGEAVLRDAEGLFAQLGAAWAQWRAMRRIERRMRAVPIAAPQTARGAAALDAVTVGDWLAGTIAHPVARARLAMHAELVFASDLAGLSLLGYLARMAATGGFAPRGPQLPGGGRDHRFVGGAQQLASAIAGELGERVVLGAPVTAVRAEPALAGAGVVVATADARYAARHVILAVPPRLAVALAPGLPAEVRALGAAMRRGGVVKCFAAYATAFWRDAGLSGEAYRPSGTVRAVVDATPPDGAAGVLLAFVVGDAAEGWRVRDPDERRGAVLAALTELFGDAAGAPLDYLEMDWAAEPWTDGCVAGTPPGALTAGAAWRGAFGRLHLAGAEAAIRWPGYMEGAIEAGERAADAVIASS